MIRSFDWRDVKLVKTLSEQGVCLDAATGLTHGAHPLQSALFAYLMPAASAPTVIWRAPNSHPKNHGPSAAFGQLRHRPGQELARVLFVAPPRVPETAEAWLRVVEQLAVEAGERGAHNLIAEVNEDSAEFEALRTAGFAIYARQSLWKLMAGGHTQPGASTKTVALRPGKSSDAIGVSTLYGNIVPRLVQQVEPPPVRIKRGYVLEQGSEVIAFLDVRQGPVGIWLEPYLHPEAYDLSEAVLHTCLDLLTNGNDKPVYVCVRRYQHWLQEIVARAGFQWMGSQAVMVKRLAARITEPLLKPLTVAEGQVPTPIVNIHNCQHSAEQVAAPLSSSLLEYWLTQHAKTNYRRSPCVDGRDSGQHWGSPQRRQPHRRPA
ncbi:MAG: hypothetical protein ACRDH2_07350 [Anaerolineales bacterium]